MDYWMEEAPLVEARGDNVHLVGEQRVVMPRRVALRMARGLLAAVAQLEDRRGADPVPLRHMN